MSAFSIQYPLINGRYYSFASIEVWIGGVPQPNIGFKSINYKASLKPGIGRGTRPHKLIRTRGEHDASADCEMYRLAWENLKWILSAGNTIGYGETAVDFMIGYAERPEMPTLTDILQAVRVTEADYSNTQGTDPSTVKLTLDPMNIIEAGAQIVTPLEAGLI